MVDPLEPDDGGPELPPGPRRSTYTPPPAGARYVPGSLTGDAVPLPAEPPTVEAMTTQPPPPPPAASDRVVWEVRTPESAGILDEGSRLEDSVPFGSSTAGSDALADVAGRTAPVSAIDLAEIPPPPSRLSLSDAELASVVDPASAAPGSTAELIDLFEEQLSLRAEEAQRLSLWEQAVRESGLPQADEIVESVRSAFTGIIDVIPPSAPSDDPWARYPGEVAPPVPSADDRQPLVIPSIDHPIEQPIDQPIDEPIVEPVPDPSPSETVEPAPTLAGILADAPPPFGLVPSEVVPPPVDGSAVAPSPEPPLDEASLGRDPESPAIPDRDATSEPPALVEPAVEPAARPTALPDESTAGSLADAPPVAGSVPRPMPSAPVGAPTGPILMSPAAVAAAALGFDDLLRVSTPEPPLAAAAPIPSPSTGSVPSGPLQAVPAADTGARSNPPALRVEASALEPTPVALRAGRSIRLFWLWFAVNSSVVSVGLGGILVGLGMSLRQAILSALVGVAVSFLPLGLGTLAGKWSGQPTMVISRATFGIVGNLLPAALAVVTRLLWAAVLLGMLGAGVAEALVSTGIAAGADPLGLASAIATVGLVLAAAVAGFGYGMIAVVAAAASVVSGILVVLVIALTTPAVDMTAALAIPDGDWVLVVTGAVLVFSVVGLAWANSSGDLARYQAKSTIGGGAVLFASFGATIPAFSLIAWGSTLASSDPTLREALASNPVGALADILPIGLGIPLVIAIALSLTAAAALALYSGGFALLATGLRTSRPMSVLIAVVLTGAIAAPLVAMAPSLDVLVRDVLTTLAVPVAAWAGIFGAETMIRTRRVHSPSLLQSGGVYPPVRWVNTVMLVVASLLGWGFTSAGVGGLDWQGYLWAATGGTGALAESDAGVAVALLVGLLTPIAAGIPAVRRLQAAEYRASLDS
ncbi:hypothetical protein GCM10009792_16510 [Microcella alkalica]|uniref:Purine-cytosine permease-like protein n=1 Tax=Microcella alkalica TaxID=355930 RepID=A0A839E754_9MICO|nr:cytosine permease [Microcella alkalica]MBA8846973.1 purine-cytosine permease-like protein [Microcella alkalica]